MTNMEKDISCKWKQKKKKNAGVAIFRLGKILYLKKIFVNIYCFLCVVFFVFVFNVYLFLTQRETEHERGRGRERGRHRMGSRLQALSHQPRARRGARTHGPRDRDLAEVGRLTDCATQAPLYSTLNSHYYYS